MARCFKRITWGVMFTMLTLAGIAMLGGCGGMGKSPLAPDPTAITQVSSGKGPSTTGPVYLSLSQKGVSGARANKPVVGTATHTERASGWFSPGRKGCLQVSFPRYADASDVQVKRVAFEVERGSLSEGKLITMTSFSGYKLGDVSVAFEPSGTEFNPPATLTIVLRGEVDPATVQVNHVHGGVVERISASVEDGEKTLTIAIKVPGFSMYSLGGSEMPPEAGTP